MSYLTDAKGQQFGLFNQSTDAASVTQVGQRFHTEDGREVVLVLNSATALDSGILCQQSPVDTNVEDLAVVSFTPLNVTTGIPASFTYTAAEVTNENIYSGGLVSVTSGTGIGQTLRIASSSPAVNGGTVTIVLEDNPVVALDTSSTVTLTVSAYSGVIINPTTPTAAPAGFTLYPISASVANTYDGTSGALLTTGTPQFGFLVVQGYNAALSDASPSTIGTAISPSTTTAGAVTAAIAGTAVIGIDAFGAVSAECQPVFANL